MIPISLKQIQYITNGKLYYSGKLCHVNSIKICSISTDTRKITPGCLFIALIGKKFNAHSFIHEAITKRARALLIQTKYLKKCNIPQIIVKNTNIALGQIAAWTRKQVNTTIIAITGSSGKTSVKEMTASILKNHGNTISTFHNLNNHIGVPLTLLKLKKFHKYAVIELGANYPKNIEYTVNITKPNIALINNIYNAHLAGFKNISGVAAAKKEIFLGLPKNGTAIFNQDNNFWPMWKKSLSTQKIISFSMKQNSTVFASDIKINNKGSKFKLHCPQGEIYISLPLLGHHNISNALAAASIAISLNIPLKIIQTSLAKLPLLKNRLQSIRLNKYKTVINDTYNANVGSMAAAIKVLEKMPGYKIFVSGDMAELGKKNIFYHKTVGNYLYNSNINKVFSIGDLSKNISKNSKKGQHFNNSQNLLDALINKLLNKKIITILVKASRIYKLEKIVQKLIETYKNTIT
ncbi:MAG: UDP-N-acetylmuramoyl-tripeptide--D-alanyl-D-alanine ligase [Buchnera aphidicola (Chaetogeoica yunlongensis)]